MATTSVLGDGALKLVTTGDVNSVTRISRPFDLNLSDIAKVSYATRQVAAADAINGNVTLRISIDANNDGTMDDQLMYEPYYNGFSGGTDWKTWNVTKTGGKFWSNFENTYNGKGGVAAGSYDSNFTLADVLAGNPNAKITAFVISMGTYNVSQTVLADDLEVTVGSDTTIFDFEPAAPIIPTASTVTVTGNTSAGENQEGWLFNRDLTTETPYEFITGTSSIGAGSLYVQPIANNYNGANGTCKAGADQTGCNKFIGELFLLTPISDIDSISYDFNIASGTVAAKGHFYMSVYANFGVSPETKFYDCRYSVVPATGSTNGFTTVTFDPALSYPVATRGGSEASPFACPASPDAMGAGATIRAVSLNVGDTSASDMGIAGYLDNVLVRTSTDSAINTTTYDFEKAAVTPPPAEETGGSSHHRRGGTRIATPVQIPTDGEVLGAQTGPECATPLFTSYMRMGDTANDPIQVKLLQSFLNVEMGSVLPITGFFGPMTDAAVKALQTKYASEVLAPWGLTQPSGWVYKFTQRKINLITCSALNIPVPSAVIDARDL